VIIDDDKQDKHRPGTRNYRKGKSVLTHPDPQALLDNHAGTGQPVNNIAVGQAGSRERVEFGRTIGDYVDMAGNSTPTSRGIIHYDGGGRAHIVPSAPGICQP
jgi:filamentous hemagglutinin